MPRALPAQLESAMEAGSFSAYVAIGKRDYTGEPPSALSGHTTLITNILYYKYDGLNLVVRYHSVNLPASDGLTAGNKYYLERGVTISGTNHTIKSASLRFDDYVIHKQVVTAFFSLFSADEKPASVSGDDTYGNVLTALNPNDYYLGTVDLKPTALNLTHWDYNFFPAGKNVDLKSYQSLLPLIRQKYLIQAVDNSDDDNEDEIQFYHLTSPVNSRVWLEPGINNRTWSACAYSDSLKIFIIGGTGYFGWSEDSQNWTENAYGSGTWSAIAWSPSLGLFAALSNTHTGTSTNGKSWSVSSPAPASNWTAMAWSESLAMFVAVNGSGTLYTSTDGSTWSSQALSGSLHAVAWSDEIAEFVVIGSSICYSSPDGSTWTSRSVPAVTWVDICSSSELELFCAIANTGEIITSEDGHAWTSRTADNSNARYGISWSSYNAQFLAAAQTGTGNRLLYSSDGITWSEGTTGTDGDWYRVCWGESLHSWVLIASTGTVYLTTSLESIAEDHSIIRDDVILFKDSVTLKFLWRDENGSIHTDGASTSLIHNLGYLESTDDPPDSYASSERGSVTTGIHLKYKSGDIFRLGINSSQASTYIGMVTEILDPKAEIGWRCEIELIERFANTNAGAMPSTIERVAAYTPLVTTNFDGNLDPTVNNLQAFAERVDDLVFSPDQEIVEDFVGAMVSGNTETGIAVTYDDANGKLNFVAEVTQAELDAHLNDTTNAHDASAIAIADSGGYFSSTDVEEALQELGVPLRGYIKDLSANIVWDSVSAYHVEPGIADVNGCLLSWTSNISRTGLTSLTSDSTYYIYLYDNSGTPAVEESTTVPTWDSVLNYFKKTGDGSRRCIGWLVIDDSNHDIRKFDSKVRGRSIEITYTDGKDSTNAKRAVNDGTASSSWQSFSLAPYVPANMATHGYLSPKIKYYTASNDTAIGISPVTLPDIATQAPYCVRDTNDTSQATTFFGSQWLPIVESQTSYYRLRHFVGSDSKAVIEIHGARAKR